MLREWRDSAARLHGYEVAGFIGGGEHGSPGAFESGHGVSVVVDAEWRGVAELARIDLGLRREREAERGAYGRGRGVLEGERLPAGEAGVNDEREVVGQRQRSAALAIARPEDGGDATVMVVEQLHGAQEFVGRDGAAEHAEPAPVSA